jgi:hypothetical protein
LGISFDPDNFALFKATRPCPADTYGVANETYGLINAPCKACTKNLRAPAGSTSFTDCKNRAGFGYTTEGANQVRTVCCCCLWLFFVLVFWVGRCTATLFVRQFLLDYLILLNIH